MIRVGLLVAALLVLGACSTAPAVTVPAFPSSTSADPSTSVAPSSAAKPAPTPKPAPSVAPKPAPAPKKSGGCNPNYGGCVPIASDVDCAGGSGNGPAYVSGPVEVTGSDVYGLDRDNDGIGCE